MKRSEMLEKLYDVTEKFVCDETSNELNLIDMILDECLKLGMFPSETTQKSIMPDVPDFKIHAWDEE
jgi:hypothetical protein